MYSKRVPAWKLEEIPKETEINSYFTKKSSEHGSILLLWEKDDSGGQHDEGNSPAERC
jgi:hypothetical protein